MDESSPPPLSEAQREIMQLVWDRGEVSVREIWKILASRRGMTRNSIQTLMVRLEEKGWLTSRADGNLSRFRASVARDSTLGMMVRRLVETAFGGSAEGWVMGLLDGLGVSRDEADRIRVMLDRAEEKSS